MRSVSGKYVVKIFLSSKIFYSENRAVYEIVWGIYGTVRQATKVSIMRRRIDEFFISDNKGQNTHIHNV
jgi:hypothetical protein